MAVQNTDRKNIYSANGATTYWPYTFSISTTDGSDLVLYVTDSDGTTTTIARSLYTVDVTNKRIKYPKTGSPVASGNKITVSRNSALTQAISLRTQSFDPRTMEKGLDKLTMIVQEQSETLSRALVTDITTTGSNFSMAAPVANKVIGWDSNAENMINYDNPAVAEAAAAASAAEAAEYAEQAANSAIEAGTVVDYEGETEPSVYVALFKWHKPSVHTIYMRDYTNTSWISLIDTATGNVLTNAATATLAITSKNGVHGQQLFTSSGTFIVPTYVAQVRITGCGGGGGGGKGWNESSYYYPGSGGGGAQCALAQEVTVTSGESITTTIGAGGASLTAGNSSSFGNYLTLNGGGSGSTASSGSYPAGGSSGGFGGQAGFNTVMLGIGGSTLFGSGGKANFSSTYIEAAASSCVGGAGIGFGSGGGSGWGTVSGGSGANGFILVEW